MRKLKNVFYIIIALLTGYMAVSVIQNSYALFETEGVALIEQDLAKWVITVNDIGVTGSTKQFDVTNFKYTTDENINENKLAPGGSCYFDIVIDAKDTNVSVKYTVNLDFSIIQNYEFIQSEVIDLTEGDVIRTGKDEYTGVLDLEEIKEGQTKTLRVKLTWNNNDENSEQDSELGLDKNANITIPVKVNLTQYTSEEIVPYNE